MHGVWHEAYVCGVGCGLYSAKLVSPTGKLQQLLCVGQQDWAAGQSSCFACTLLVYVP